MNLNFTHRPSIPEDTQCIIITCHPAHQPLFKGIEQACALIQDKKYFYIHNWNGGKLRLSNLTDLTAVILSGHGRQQQAGLTGAKNLTPSALKLPEEAQLYLISCYQGAGPLLATWSKKSGLPTNQIFAFNDEVEVLLSTLFFIMLYEYGLAGLPAAFQRWQYANKYLKPFFPLIREIYKRNHFNYLPAVEEIKTIINLDALRDMVKLGENYPGYLSGLY